MGRKKRLKTITTNVPRLCKAHNMTLRSLAKCVKQVGYPEDIEVTYMAVIRFVAMDEPKRINAVMLSCVCQVFDIEIGSILKLE